MTASSSFGRYQTLRLLGSGGMADVYLARDPVLGREVAVKVLTSSHLDATMLTRFMGEAKAVAQLEHPAIVPLYDYGESGGRPFLIMRYMPGGSLGDRIGRGALAVGEATTVIDRIAAALDHAHSRGVIHRDVKPGNILFDESGAAYLADFGIARFMSPSMGDSLTSTGTIIGTVAYMSPEQALGKPVDGRSDIYSLGVVLFEMLAGDVPYRADSQLQQAMQHVNAPIPSIRQRRRDLPPATQSVIKRALAKEPKARYHTAAAMAVELRRVISGGQVKRGARPLPALLMAGALIIVLAFLIRTTFDNEDGSATAIPQSEIAITEEVAAPKEVATAEETEPAIPPTSTPFSATPEGAEPAAIAPTTLPQAGDSRDVTLPGGKVFQQVFVPAGAFLMGSLDDPDAKGNEFPQHETYVDAFWLDRTEVTNDQFAAFVEDTDYLTSAERVGSGKVRVETGWLTVEGVSWRNPNHPDEDVTGALPVVQVSWDDAQAYCNWVGGRLPSEAEWEYAARGPSGQLYPWGDEFTGRNINYCDQNCPFSWANKDTVDGYGTTAPVGSLLNGASWVGAYDMIGNVWEWINDWYANGYYEDAPYTNPFGPETGDFRVLRGGAWYNLAETMRPAERGSDRPGDSDNGAGFRCVVEATDLIQSTPSTNSTTATPSPTVTTAPGTTDTINTLPPVSVISLIEPADCNRPANFRDTWSIEFKWQYSQRLAPGQYMEIRIEPNEGIASQGKVLAPSSGDQWLQVVSVSNFDIDAGVYRWQVVLMDGDGSSALAYSDYGCFTIWSDNG